MATRPPLDELDLTLAQTVLQKAAPGEDVALVWRKNLSGVIEVHSAKAARAAQEPHSALTRLIQGLWETYGTDARQWVRRPLLSTGAMTEMDYGMVRVAAKRVRRVHGLELSGFAPSSAAIQWLQLVSSPPLVRPVLPLGLNEGDPLSSREAMDVASWLANRVARAAIRAESHRPIGAVLLDRDGRLLDWMANDNGRNRTHHAEVRLVQRWWDQTRRPLPRGSRVFTTLKPCKMCAGMIWTAAEEPSSLDVTFRDFDDGPFARTTVLTASSPERRRASSRDDEIRAVLERPFDG